MGTKLQPGKYDCHSKLKADEPHFVLKSTDPLAPELVERWALLATDQPMEKRQEALNCARDMREWKIIEEMKERGQLKDPEALAQWDTAGEVEDVIKAAGADGETWRPAPHLGRWVVYNEHPDWDCYLKNKVIDEAMGV